MKTKIFNPKKLQSERARLKMSFWKFALALQSYEPKANKSIVWQWEHGKHQPSARYLIAICSVFNRKIDFFYK